MIVAPDEARSSLAPEYRRDGGRGTIARSSRSDAMYKTLTPGAIGVKTDDLTESLVAAKLGNFEGLEVSAGEIANLVEQRGAERVRRQFDDAGIRPAAFGLPV